MRGSFVIIAIQNETVSEDYIVNGQNPQMGTLQLLDGIRLERYCRTIRRDVSALRRRKLTLSTGNAHPGRNPTLDQMFLDFQRERLILDDQIRDAESTYVLNTAEDEALSHVREIQRHMAEIVELLIWFGAKMPAVESEQHDPRFRG